MSMLLDIFAKLLAWGGAAAWVLTGGDKLRSDLKRNGRPGGYRTAHFRNCRF